MKELDPVDHRDYEDEVFVYTHPEYMLEVIKTLPEVVKESDGEYSMTHIEFKVTSGEIVAALDRFCKNSGIRNPYENASVFASRLKNDQPLLKKSGWDLVSRAGFEPYYTRIRGERFWKFRKTVVR